MLWLAQLGAEVTGYSLAPRSPSLFIEAGLRECGEHVEGDIRDRRALGDVFAASRPELIFHLAAQALVRAAHDDPLGTFETNVTGTANVLELARARREPLAIVVVTSDKCYRPPPPVEGHREDDALGGDEPYAASKAAAELVVHAYRSSFFSPADLARHGVAVATARAGNVIGGGDCAPDRIVPDVMRALASGQPIAVRNPDSVRPWQHVLEPLSGYLQLGARLIAGEQRVRSRAATAWNFGPARGSERTVADLCDALIAAWGGGSWRHAPEAAAANEAATLRLDSGKAAHELGWTPRWDFAEACRRTVEWYRLQHAGAAPQDLQTICLRQIGDYAPSWT